ncbi:MAG TPA: DUF1697 domain-containing protein [Bryobacteraceae bacterium]|nr:DUF1697 domain-containing protein [Bryobacteraceae bacterium]
MKYVALLRGVNVGGKNSLPMKELASMFDKAGCAEVRTYIQSGNVVFAAPAPLIKTLAAKIAGQIEKRFGFRSPVVLRSLDQLRLAIRDNPFVKPDVDPKALHIYFLADEPGPQAIATLDPNRSSPDAFLVRGCHIYLHMPNGMGRTKLTNAYFDSKLSTVSTARNWSTVHKLLEMMS